MIVNPYDGMGVFPFLSLAVFILVSVVIIITIVKSVTQWNKNNHSPVLTVEAQVVAKRVDVRHHTHQDGTDNMSSSYTTADTSYYATFQVESGDRLEFRIQASEYAMLAEGDRGRLTFQGTRYRRFDRSLE